MKKDRNTFFGSSEYMSQTQFPNPGLNIANSPFATGSFSSSSFYSGPNNQIPMNYNIPNNQMANYNNDYNDIESRLSKIERQINRLDTRINKLESGTFYNDEIDNTTNVYMV